MIEQIILTVLSAALLVGFAWLIVSVAVSLSDCGGDE